MCAPTPPAIVKDANPELYPCARLACTRTSVIVTVSPTGSLFGRCVTHALHVLHPHLLT